MNKIKLTTKDALSFHQNPESKLFYLKFNNSEIHPFEAVPIPTPKHQNQIPLYTYRLLNNASIPLKTFLFCKIQTIHKAKTTYKSLTLPIEKALFVYHNKRQDLLDEFILTKDYTKFFITKNGAKTSLTISFKK
jgi:hypothetical protein